MVGERMSVTATACSATSPGSHRAMSVPRSSPWMSFGISSWLEIQAWCHWFPKLSAPLNPWSSRHWACWVAPATVREYRANGSRWLHWLIVFAAYLDLPLRTPSVKAFRVPAWRAWVTAVSKASRWRCTFMFMIDGMWAVLLTLSAPPCHPVVGQLVSCSHPTAMLTASCREWLGLVSWWLGCTLSRSSSC